jgi:aspartate/methionine/tyrosine aminotransferase
LGRKHVRFSFCKNDEVLLAAGERLATMKAKL